MTQLTNTPITETRPALVESAEDWSSFRGGERESGKETEQR